MKEKVFEIKHFAKKPTFASFLPGISGIRGIPVWCYYVNRGQGVVSFGVQDKDHAIMEFYPAHQAYQNAARTGFRTFVKKDAGVVELFTDADSDNCMYIYRNGLELSEVLPGEGIRACVRYFTLPREGLGALVRKVELQNISGEPIKLEILDGMPAVIPYGIDNESLKTMGQLMKAWMEVEQLDSRVPFFKTRASTADSTVVTLVEGGNFSMGILPDGTRLKPIVDPRLVFDYDTALQRPAGFMSRSLEQLYEAKQEVKNQYPCSFYGISGKLQPEESFVYYQLIGQADNRGMLEAFLEKEWNGGKLEEKWQLAQALTRELCQDAYTHTALPDFDEYCAYTYMDNVLRGGYPIELGGNKTFYIYSRKHGDLEREYNYFRLLPQYYTQGNGNYRDVNQNRRCDVFFHPEVERDTIRRFYGLIQLDGYNPLGIEKITYHVSGDKLKKLFCSDTEASAQAPRWAEFLRQPFTPGECAARLEALPISEAEQEKLLDRILSEAEENVGGSFLEGYWSDHFTYNLDLVESYLEIYPDKERELYFEERFPTFAAQAMVNPRRKRYVETENGLRQHNALTEGEEGISGFVRLKGEEGGDIWYMSLLEKLLLLDAVKFATLDAWGMGVEMEGGKPGWYDALNGMPALFGSAVTETCELERMLRETLRVLKKYGGSIPVMQELSELLKQTDIILREEQPAKNPGQLLTYWNRINDAKERYRERIYQGISGRRESFSAEELIGLLKQMHDTVVAGIRKAQLVSGELSPAYFAYMVPRYHKTEDGIEPEEFVPVVIPSFLEGAVRLMKTEYGNRERKAIYTRLKEGPLYDKKLHMYKVNASLENASFEIGRAKAFTPGWLENESIWLHMEYKYLLELLKASMYEEFWEDFKKAAVPFLDPEVYGRSIYENVSFIASSANPNASCHGRGFVARLSGSTVEFLQMWKLLFFGSRLFTEENGELRLTFSPFLPKELIPQDGIVEAAFLGSTRVVYHTRGEGSFIPGTYSCQVRCIEWKDGRQEKAEPAEEQTAKEAGIRLTGRTAAAIRNKEAAVIHILLKK